MSKTSILWLTGSVCAFLLFACFCGAGFLVDGPVYLIVGWIPFLVRVGPKIEVDWAGVATTVVCLILLSVGLHWFCGWWHRQRASKPNLPDASERGSADAQPIWKVRWTFAILSLIVMMFVAGIAAVGLTHHTIWLANSKEPLTETWREGAALRTQSLNNIKQMGLASHGYHDGKKSLPPGATFDSLGRPLHGWPTHLLPYVEQWSLYKSLKLKLPWDHPDNEKAGRREIPIYLSPYGPMETPADGFPLIHYAANPLVMGGDKGLKLSEFPDGTSNTILLGEAKGDFKAWRYPLHWRDPALGLNKSPQGFGNPGNLDGALFGMADGSGRLISNQINPEVFQALFTPAGREKSHEIDD